MDGKYEVGLDHIRALAIQCHALDLQFDHLFNEPTIGGTTEQTYRTYNRLFSTSLLNLAISIRVSLSTEPEYSLGGLVSPAVLLLDGESLQGHDFTIKDICDKLIHAEAIHKPREPMARGAGCELSGRHLGKTWKLGLGVRIFSEYVVAWVDQIELRRNELP